MIMLGDKKKKLAAILGPVDEPRYEEHEHDGLHAVCEEVLEAIKSNDVHGLGEALKAAFLHFDSEPHEEGPHTNEE